jgi:hypothetical protein
MSKDMQIRGVVLRSAVVVVLGAGCAVMFAVGWSSPIRIALAVGFLLVGPGLAIAELLEIHDVALRVAIATGASLALETIVAVPLIYAGAYSATGAFAVVLAITAGASAAAVARAARARPPGREGRWGRAERSDRRLGMAIASMLLETIAAGALIYAGAYGAAVAVTIVLTVTAGAVLLTVRPRIVEAVRREPRRRP